MKRKKRARASVQMHLVFSDVTYREPSFLKSWIYPQELYYTELRTGIYPGDLSDNWELGLPDLKTLFGVCHVHVISLWRLHAE